MIHFQMVLLKLVLTILADRDLIVRENGFKVEMIRRKEKLIQKHHVKAVNKAKHQRVNRARKVKMKKMAMFCMITLPQLEKQSNCFGRTVTVPICVI